MPIAYCHIFSGSGKWGTSILQSLWSWNWWNRENAFIVSQPYSFVGLLGLFICITLQQLDHQCIFRESPHHVAYSVAWNLRVHWQFSLSFCRLLLPLSVSTLSGLGAPSWPPCPPSSRCGSASKSMMRQAPPSSTASASKVPSLLVYITFRMMVWCFLESSEPPSLISHQSLYSLFTHVQFICASNIYCFINKPDQDLQPTKASISYFCLGFGEGVGWGQCLLAQSVSLYTDGLDTMSFVISQHHISSSVWLLAGSYNIKFWFYPLGQNHEDNLYLKSKLGFQFSSVAQLCLTLCDPMNCSMPGFPVHHQLPEIAQTHVHRVGDAIQPSHPLSFH